MLIVRDARRAFAVHTFRLMYEMLDYSILYLPVRVRQNAYTFYYTQNTRTRPGTVNGVY